MSSGNLVRRVAAAAIVFGLSGSAAVAQLAPPIPAPPMPAPSIPQPMPSPDSTIPTVPDPPQAVAAPPAVEAAPFGIHRTADGKWALDPGCHWVHPDDADDLSAVCN